jgi:hypothetical protein
VGTLEFQSGWLGMHTHTHTQHAHAWQG